MAFGRSERMSILTKSPMVGLMGMSPTASSSTSKRQSAFGEAQMVGPSPMGKAMSDASHPSRKMAQMVGPSPMGKTITDAPSPSKKLGARMSAFRRTKSQPGSGGAAPMRTRGPSPGITGPSPGSWASPAWSASPNGGPAYLYASPAAFNQVPEEGQWWLLEARRMREETRRVHAETVRLRALVADKEEEMQHLGGKLESKTEQAERLNSELQAAENIYNTLRPELEQSQEAREQQVANIGSLQEGITGLVEERREFQEANVEHLKSSLEAALSESRGVGNQLRQAQSALEVAQNVVLIESVAVYLCRKFQSRAAIFQSQLEVQYRRREELEESLRQALEQAQAAQADRVEIDRMSKKLSSKPLKQDDDYDVLEAERDVLREEVRKLNAQIQKMQAETCVNCGTMFAPAARDCRTCGWARVAKVTSDVESSGCDDGTICVLTPRSQITDGSREPSEANLRFDRDLQGRLKKNATDADVRAAEAQLRKVYLSYVDEPGQTRPRKNSVMSSVGFSESPSYSASPASDFRPTDADVRAAESHLRKVYLSACSKARE